MIKDIHVVILNKIFYYEQILLCTLFYFQIPIILVKETDVNENGEEVMKCGFKIGGGIDQDFRKSPQGYTDNVMEINMIQDIVNASHIVRCY